MPLGYRAECAPGKPLGDPLGGHLVKSVLVP